MSQAYCEDVGRDEEEDVNVSSSTLGQTLVGEKSGLAREVSRLHDASKRAVEKRDHIPQPLFWSLFHSRIKSIKRRKEKDRLVRSVLDNL